MSVPKPAHHPLNPWEAQIEGLQDQLEHHEKMVDQEMKSLQDPSLAPQRLASFLLNLPDPTLKGWDGRMLHPFKLQLQALEQSYRAEAVETPQSGDAPFEERVPPSPRMAHWGTHS